MSTLLQALEGMLSGCKAKVSVVTLLITCAAATIFMTGLGFLVQFVAYPLFSEVGSSEFVEYHAGWSARITPVVFVPMSVELLSAAALVVNPPPGSTATVAAIGLALAGVTWLSTVFLQVPAHSRLATGFNADSHRRLVRTSWVRTLAWTGHSLVVCAMLAAA